MKCVTEYKKKVDKLNDEYHKRLGAALNVQNKDFIEYLDKLAALDLELIMAIRREKKVAVYSSFY